MRPSAKKNCRLLPLPWEEGTTMYSRSVVLGMPQLLPYAPYVLVTIDQPFSFLLFCLILLLLLHTPTQYHNTPTRPVDTPQVLTPLRPSSLLFFGWRFCLPHPSRASRLSSFFGGGRSPFRNSRGLWTLHIPNTANPFSIKKKTPFTRAFF